MLSRINKEDQRFIKQRLGNYVAHKVVRRNQVLCSVDELNGLDRRELARTWFEQETYWYKTEYNRIIENYFEGFWWFIEAVAIYIDSRIPGTYIKYKENLNPGVDSIKVPFDTDFILPYGLKYWYSENLTSHAPSSMIGATSPQLRYLHSLACKNNYSFFDEDITKDQASKCIDYFLNMDFQKEPKYFSQHFRKDI